MTSPYALSLLERIKKKNKKKPVTVELMIERKTYRASGKIANAIKELRAQGLISYRTIQDHGRYATEIVFDGAIKHDRAPRKLGKDEGGEDSESKGTKEFSKPTRKYQKRKVRRSAI
jgi:hypothetical protein